jgi:hypothetical protein
MRNRAELRVNISLSHLKYTEIGDTPQVHLHSDKPGTDKWACYSMPRWSGRGYLVYLISYLKYVKPFSFGYVTDHFTNAPNKCNGNFEWISWMKCLITNRVGYYIWILLIQNNLAFILYGAADRFWVVAAGGAVKKNKKKKGRKKHKE